MGKTRNDITKEVIQQWKDMRAAGSSWRDIEKHFKWRYSSTTICRYVAKNVQLNPAQSITERLAHVIDAVLADPTQHVTHNKYVYDGEVLHRTCRYLWRLLRKDPLPKFTERTCNRVTCVNPFHYQQYVPRSHLITTTEQREKMYHLWIHEGLSMTRIAERMGCHYKTVAQYTIQRFIREVDEDKWHEYPWYIRRAATYNRARADGTIRSPKPPRSRG